jgi:hypothetical protein
MRPFGPPHDEECPICYGVGGKGLGAVLFLIVLVVAVVMVIRVVLS